MTDTTIRIIGMASSSVDRPRRTAADARADAQRMNADARGDRARKARQAADREQRIAADLAFLTADAQRSRGAHGSPSSTQRQRSMNDVTTRHRPSRPPASADVYGWRRALDRAEERGIR